MRTPRAATSRARRSGVLAAVEALAEQPVAAALVVLDAVVVAGAAARLRGPSRRHHSGLQPLGPLGLDHPARRAAPDEAGGRAVGQFGDGLHRLGRIEQQDRTQTGRGRGRRGGAAGSAATQASTVRGSSFRAGAAGAPPPSPSLACSRSISPARASARRLWRAPRSRPGARSTGSALQAAEHQGVDAEAQVQPLQALLAQQPHQVGGRGGRGAEAGLDRGGAAVDAEAGQPQPPRALAVALELGGQGLGQARQLEADALGVDQRIGELGPGAVERRRPLGDQGFGHDPQGLVQPLDQPQPGLAAEPAGQARARQAVEIADLLEAEAAQQRQGLGLQPQRLHRQARR